MIVNKRSHVLVIMSVEEKGIKLFGLVAWIKYHQNRMQHKHLHS